MRRAFTLSLLVGLCHCGGGQESGGGLIVKQVLRGGQTAAAAVDAASAPEAGATPPPVPGMSLGSTLVADTSRALYRRAYDQSRRRADGLTARERLMTIDEAIDDESQQEESFSAQE